MSKIDQALDVLMRARDQMVSEMAHTGNNGGVGRVQSYAPVFVNIINAIAALEAMQTAEVSVADKMAAVRAAKAAKQTV